MKNRTIAASAGVLVTGLLAACGSPDGSGGPASASAPSGAPITVALIPPTTGSLAAMGSDSAQAWEFAVNEVNAKGGLLGRTVQIVKLDTDGTPTATLRAAREAVTQRGASFIGAVVTSSENAALNGQLEALGALSFNGLAKDDALTGKNCSKNAFRVSVSNRMDINAVSPVLATLPGSRWAIQAVDYSTGHSAAAAFKTAAAEHGKSVVLEQFAPLNTPDFGPFISTLAGSDADALFAVEQGADGVTFVNQLAQFNIGSKFKSVLGFNMVSEQTFAAVGDRALGYYNNVTYDVNADNPLNRDFVKAWTAKTNQAPYFISADNYLAAQTLFEGIRQAGSTDPEKVRDALEDHSFDSIVGQVTLRGADHQMVRDTHLGKVVRDAGGASAFDVVHSAKGADIVPPADPACSL